MEELLDTVGLYHDLEDWIAMVGGALLEMEKNDPNYKYLEDIETNLNSALDLIDNLWYNN